MARLLVVPWSIARICCGIGVALGSNEWSAGPTDRGPTDRGPTDLSKGGVGLAGQVLWVQLYFQASTPATDEQLRPAGGAGVDESAQAFFLPQWADATQQIAGAALSRSGIRHGDLLGARSLGQQLQIQSPVNRHHSDQQLPGLRTGQQRLEHLLRIQAELFSGFPAI